MVQPAILLYFYYLPLVQGVRLGILLRGRCAIKNHFYLETQIVKLKPRGIRVTGVDNCKG